MQANRDKWAKTGAMAKLERCEPKARPRVRINEGAGALGTASDYRVLLGTRVGLNAEPTPRSAPAFSQVSPWFARLIVLH